MKLKSNSVLSLLIALLLLAATSSKALRLVKLLCKECEEELKEAFRFCEGLKVPSVENQYKISWQRVTQEPSFVLDNEFYLLDSMAFLCSYKQEDLLYLLGLLNSKVIFYYFKQIGHLYSDKGFLLSNQYVERFPIPKITKQETNLHQKIISLVKQVLDSKKKDLKQDTKALENELDSLIYKLYKLDKEEIRLIESAFNAREREREREQK